MKVEKIDNTCAKNFVSRLISHEIDETSYAHEALTHSFVYRDWYNSK